MHCRKCDCFFPDSEKICPVCKNDKAESKLSNYTSLALGLFVLFLFGCYFNPAISFFVVLFISVPCVLLTNKEYNQANKNNGFFFTEKTLKFKKKNNSSPAIKTPHFTKSTVMPNAGMPKTSQSNTLDNFKDNLSIVWTDADSDYSILIEFSYSGFSDGMSRRNIIVTEVSVNQYFELYFIGYCLDKSDERTFKVNRITSQITFNGKKYSKEKFVDDILFLDSSEFS